jgi:uncharacterized protein
MYCYMRFARIRASRSLSALLEALVNAPTAYGMAPQVLASVIRISTHPRIYVQPSILEEAMESGRLLLTPETCTVVHPGERHWEIFVDL